MRLQKQANGGWFLECDCYACLDSGIAESLSECDRCEARVKPHSERLFAAICVLMAKGREVDPLTLNMARLLVSATTEKPVPGEALAGLLGGNLRRVKRMVRVLRDEWALPVCGRREKPHGYFFASTVAELLEWSRVTRSQAVSELATMHRLQRKCFPEFFQQGELAFAGEISEELVEALR